MLQLHRLAFCIALATVVLTTTHNASAYTYKVIHDFCSRRHCADGQAPLSGVVMDAEGKLYGTTQFGGSAVNGPGTVYELVPNLHHTKWDSFTLYKFNSGPSGMSPIAAPILDADGNLYGTTFYGGEQGAGTAYELMANDKPSSLRTLKVLSYFSRDSGQAPMAGLSYQGKANGVPYDGVSPLYGVAESGGAHGDGANGGTVYELTPSGGAWTLTTLYDFCATTNCADGNAPVGTLILDANGRIFGTTAVGGSKPKKMGVAYELAESGGTWTLSVLHDFCLIKRCMDGAVPYNALLRDGLGNLYGTTIYGGENKNAGVVFKLAPDGTYSTIYSFCALVQCRDGEAPRTDLLMDSKGTLYGTTANGGNNNDADHIGGGTVFALRGSTLETLYRFCAISDCSDGEYPVDGGLIMDSQGNLFGTTFAGGKYGAGVVFELSP